MPLRSFPLHAPTLPSRAALMLFVLVVSAGCAPTSLRTASADAECAGVTACPPPALPSGSPRTRSERDDFPPPPPDAPGDLTAPGTDNTALPPGLPPMPETPADAPASDLPLDPVVPRDVASGPAASEVEAGRNASPPPEPVMPTPPRARTEAVRLSAEALFGVGAYRLTPAGRASLDDIARILKRESYSQIVITGHSDRSGLPGENRRTSERRANAVRAYLTSKGLPAKRMRAEGLGPSQATIGPEDCAPRKGPARAACFQLDRHVHIRVVR